MAAYQYKYEEYEDDGESISSGSNPSDDDPHRNGGGMGLPSYQYPSDGVMLDSGGGNNGSNLGMAGGAGGANGLMMMNSSSINNGDGSNNMYGHPHAMEDGAAAVDFDDPRIANLPRILLMGPRRAGKTSIQRVVFHKMSPHETLFRLEATQMLERAVVDHTPLCRFTIWDFPGDQYEYNYGYGGHGGMRGGMAGIVGQKDSEGRFVGVDGGYNAVPPEGDVLPSNMDPNQQQQQQQLHHQNSYDDQIFSKATALIFVLDAQDEPYDHVLQSFTDTVTRAVRANPTIAVEVFVHKVDGELFLSDEAKYDCRRDVMQQVADELADAGLSHDAIPISYHLTSIYDHSVFEAFSRVVQRLIPESPTLEHLLNVLVSTCSMEKAYLFDVASKLYISTDSSPVDMQSVELCSDMIDVVLDVSGIYGLGSAGGSQGHGSISKGSSSKPMEIPSLDDGKEDGEDPFGGGLTGNHDHGAGGGMPANELTGIDPDEADDLDALHGHGGPAGNESTGEDELLGKLVGQSPPSAEEDEDEDDVNDADAGSAYDSESSSTIHLSNGMVLYLKEVDTMLALVCLTKAENFRKKSLINYNIGCLKKALRVLPSTNQTVSAGGM